MCGFFANKLDILHNRCIRFIYKLPKDARLSYYKNLSNIMTPLQCRQFYIGNVTYKIYKNYNPVFKKATFKM